MAGQPSAIACAVHLMLCDSIEAYTAADQKQQQDAVPMQQAQGALPAQVSQDARQIFKDAALLEH